MYYACKFSHFHSTAYVRFNYTFKSSKAYVATYKTIEYIYILHGFLYGLLYLHLNLTSSIDFFRTFLIFVVEIVKELRGFSCYSFYVILFVSDRKHGLLNLCVFHEDILLQKLVLECAFCWIFSTHYTS